MSSANDAVDIIKVSLTFENVTPDAWEQIHADLLAADPLIIDVEGIPESWRSLGKLRS